MIDFVVVGGCIVIGAVAGYLWGWEHGWNDRDSDSLFNFRINRSLNETGSTD